MSDKPNIIYILGDDHRAEVLGCMDHPIVKTPNIDCLASEGVLFRNGFCTSPACTPSRACHYTGQWERKHGVNFNSHSSLAPEAWENSFPMRLKDAGYHIGWVGKNHVPAGEGGYSSGYFEEVFDYWYGNHGHSGFYPKEQAGGNREIYNNARADTQVEVFEEGALNFLDPQREFIERCSHPLTARPEDKPFCLCVTFNLPHAYGTGSMELRPSDDEHYRSHYQELINDIPLPETYVASSNIETPRIPRDVYNGIYLSSYDYVRSPSALRERRVREYQTITGMDNFIGRLRETLARLQLADNTIIVFSTDHGIHHGEHGLGGKCFLYEEDLRIPLVVYDPRLKKEARGQVRDEIVVVPDLAPTVMQMVGLDVPEAMQGKSLKPLLQGETPEWREEFFSEQLLDIQNYPRSECVRTKDWKYIRYFKRTEDPNQTGQFRGTLDNYNDSLTSSLHGEQPVYEELFHLAKDPGEVTNLAGVTMHESKLNELRGRILFLGREAKEDNCAPMTLSVGNGA
jgi:arylsulfatase A-like enzyme